jgi:hypothetical protein
LLAGDQVVGQRKARHRLEAPGPGFQIWPIADREAALGHEHHAPPAADVRDRAGVADEKGPLLDGRIDKGQRRLGARPELGDDLVVHFAKPRRVAHPRDRGDVVGLPRQPLPRLPPLLLGPSLEMTGRARQIVEDHVRLQDHEAAVPQ